jgi:hypothetical protein
VLQCAESEKLQSSRKDARALACCMCAEVGVMGSRGCQAGAHTVGVTWFLPDCSL